MTTRTEVLEAIDGLKEIASVNATPVRRVIDLLGKYADSFVPPLTAFEILEAQLKDAELVAKHVKCYNRGILSEAEFSLNIRLICEVE